MLYNYLCQAIMVNLGYSVQENWAAFNATNDLLMETHWTLLEGAAAKTPYPAVNAARPGSAVVRCGLLWSVVVCCGSGFWSQKAKRP